LIMDEAPGLRSRASIYEPPFSILFPHALT
jgi:hypothetical protein